MDAFALGKQLNIPDDKICRKAEELIRLTRVRAPHGIGVSEICKGVICLDLASSVLSKPFDRKTAMALATLTIKDYQLAYNSLQNILQIRPNLSFEELASQFNCQNVAPDCHKFFESYKEKFLASVEEHRRPYADFSKPVFNSVAFFVVTKLNKLSVDKNKLMEIGLFSPREFQSVYESMTTLCEVVFPADASQKRKREDQPSAEELEEKKAKNAAYEEWKKKALAKEETPQSSTPSITQSELPTPQTISSEQSNDTTAIPQPPSQEQLPQNPQQEPEASEQQPQNPSLPESSPLVEDTEPVNDENSSKNINQSSSTASSQKELSKSKGASKPKLKQLTLFSFKPQKSVQKEKEQQSHLDSSSVEPTTPSQTE